MRTLVLLAAALTPAVGRAADPPAPARPVAPMFSVAGLVAPEPVPSATYEVRLLKVPAGFCERMRLKADDPALTEREVGFLLEAAQGCRNTSVMQAPKMTAASGEPVTASVVDRAHYVTGLDLVKVKGDAVFVPRNTPVDVGYTFTVGGKVADDGKSVEVSAKVTHTRVEGNVELVPVVTQVTPVFEGGSRGKPVPVTQFLQATDVKTHTAEGTAVVPSGGTLVLGTWKEPADAPVCKTLPGMSRLFEKPASPAECDVVVLVTTRVCRDGKPEVAAPTPRPAAGARYNEVYKLRHAAAADAADAVNAVLTAERRDPARQVVVVAEPVSNTVLVSAPEGDQKRVLGLLAGVDVARPQVLVEAMFVEVPRNFLDDVGLSSDEDKGNVLTLTRRERKVLDTQFRKAKERDTVSVLSRPQVQVADNQTGFVQVGANFPYLSTSTLTGVGTAQQSIAYEPIGVTMRVTPRVNPDGKVLMRVEPTVSSVSPSLVSLGPGINAPAFNTQTVQTTVLASDGETAVVRGLAAPKGPAGEQREYLILLTPHVVKGDRK